MLCFFTSDRLFAFLSLIQYRRHDIERDTRHFQCVPAFASVPLGLRRVPSAPLEVQRGETNLCVLSEYQPDLRLQLATILGWATLQKVTLRKVPSFEHKCRDYSSLGL